jgi:hypothetical protein
VSLRISHAGRDRRVRAVRLLLAAGVTSALAAAAARAQERRVPASAPPAVVVLNVPYVPQTEALCGGAAAAMVMRYWGARDVAAEDFAALVERELGGISTLRLVDAVETRGFEAHAFRGEGAVLAHHLEQGRPVIALLEPRPGRRHYVVIVAWYGSRALVHDPAEGAYRVWDQLALERAWEPTGRWTLLLLPRDGARRAPQSGAPWPATEALAPSDAVACGGLVPDAVTLARAGDLVAAEQRLAAAVGLCPASAAAHRELAGVRFRQQRYLEAIRLSERALAVAPGDAPAWRLLATSRFLAGERDAALAAWNHVGEPVLDLVRIEGLARTRPGVVSARLDLAPRSLLTPAGVRRAERRLGALPSLRLSAVRVEPIGGGRADAVAVAVERSLVPPWRPLAATLAIDAVTRRETRLRLASPAHRGDALEAGLRWWSGRPAFWLELQAPAAFGVPGIVTLAALYDEQRYAVAAQPASVAVVERRRSARLAAADWWSADLTGELELGVERISELGTSLVPGLRLERRLARDRAALVARGSVGLPLGDAAAYARGELRAAWRSATHPAPLRWQARAGYVAASARSPLAAWPGAGTGTGRETLLRAHPLIADGVVVGEGFGRRLFDAGAELEACVVCRASLSISAAAFLDAARVWDPLGSPAGGAWLADAGLGLRVRLATAGVLRLDVATPLSGGAAITLSAGWQPSWPH